MTEGPLTQAFNLGHAKALRQELITYTIDEGVLYKHIVIRVYSTSRDYIDSSSTIVIGNMNEN
tara:strand:- start:292 stop:480 length:189 start_codon:yes stop_codon:yes gene_type:complete